jgi:hypothetical protein
MAGLASRYGIYMRASLSPNQRRGSARIKGVRPKPAGLTESLMLSQGVLPMLDIAYLVVGALFLGLCALYALACENL